MTDVLTRTCTSYCAEVHNEQPGDAVFCRSAQAEIPVTDRGTPLLVQVGFLRDEPSQEAEVWVGDRPLNLAGLQQLQRELVVAEQMLLSSVQ